MSLPFRVEGAGGAPGEWRAAANVASRGNDPRRWSTFAARFARENTKFFTDFS